jgi:hypothetical protein
LDGLCEDVRLPVELRGGPHLYFLMMVKRPVL